MISCISFFKSRESVTWRSSSLPSLLLSRQYRWKSSDRLRAMASFRSGASSASSSSSSNRMTSASRNSPSCSKWDSSARSRPSASTRTTLCGSLITCFTAAMVPMRYRSSCPGASVCTSFCATRKILCSRSMACSIAFTERSLLTSKCITIPGRMVIPRSATTGNVSIRSFTYRSSCLFPLFFHACGGAASRLPSSAGLSHNTMRFRLTPGISSHCSSSQAFPFLLRLPL